VGRLVIDIINALPDGSSVVSVIVVIILISFLKRFDKVDSMLKTTTKHFHDLLYDSQRNFQDQILKLSKQHSEQQKSYQSQIQALIDAHIQVSKETILALKGLEMSLKEAKERGQVR
jgi:hypothetical protein